MNSRVSVYTPIDSRPLTWDRIHSGVKKDPDNPWETGSVCRFASQILVGIEVLELMLIYEAIAEKRIPWLPFSIHHDGFAFLGERKDLDQYMEMIEAYTGRIRTNRTAAA
jgi:hypothetical protein